MTLIIRVPCFSRINGPVTRELLMSAIYSATPETNLFKDADWNSFRTTSC